VLAKPNVIMNDIRLRAFAVAGNDAAEPAQPRPDRSKSKALAPECGRWSPANPGRWIGQQILAASRFPGVPSPLCLEMTLPLGDQRPPTGLPAYAFAASYWFFSSSITLNVYSGSPGVVFQGKA
jgi:hypothetical protein